MKRTAIDPKPEIAISDELLDVVIATVVAAIEETIQDRVDEELLFMVNGEAFATRIAALIDDRFQVMVTQISIQTSAAGPGRGRKGRTHKKISLSLPETLYNEAKALDGFLSCHVASALELYLKLQKR